MHSLSTKKSSVIAVSLVVIVGIFAYIFVKKDGVGDLTIKSGEHEISFSFKDKELSLEDLLKTLLENPIHSKLVYSMLRDNYNLYHRESDFLIDSFRRESPDSELSKNIRELLVDLKGPFSRDAHTYHDITRVNTVDAINNLGYEHPVSSRLRDLKDSVAGIFEERGVEVIVSFISSTNILDGNAAVCKGSKYRGRDLLLLNPNDTNKTISVFSRNTTNCLNAGAGESEKAARIQINHNDAKKLFGDIVLSKTEKAVLYPAQQNAHFKPILVGSI